MNNTILFDNISYEIDIFNLLRLGLLTLILISDSSDLFELILQSCAKYTILLTSISMLVVGSYLIYFDIFLGIISIFLGGSLFTIFIILHRI